MGDEQVMHASGIRGARHAELATGVSTEDVRHQLALFNERLRVSRQTIAIEGRAAQGTHQVRTLIDGQPFRKQLLTQGAFKER